MLRLLLALSLALSAPAFASSTARLPASACSPDDLFLADGYEDPGAATPAGPSDPSHGTGGGIGDSSGTVTVAGYGTGTYYLHVPASYDPARPMPVLFALHGAAGSHLAATSYAQQIRIDWTPIADAGGFIVIAPVSNNSQGGWTVPASAGGAQYDYGIIAAALLDVEARYNIERARVYGWGYSAGGHVMYDLVVNGLNSTVNANTVAAYGINAGVLGDEYAPTYGLACRGMTEAQCSALVALMPRQVPLDIHVGVSDPFVTHARGDHYVFLGQGWIDYDTIYYTEFNGDHSNMTTGIGEIWTHICGFGVVP